MDWQQFGFSRIKPFLPGHALAFGAVAISARVIGNSLGAAMVALFYVATEFGRSTAQNVVDNLVVHRQKREGIPILANVSPKNVCNLERGLSGRDNIFAYFICLSHDTPPCCYGLSWWHRTDRGGF